MNLQAGHTSQIRNKWSLVRELKHHSDPIITQLQKLNETSNVYPDRSSLYCLGSDPDPRVYRKVTGVYGIVSRCAVGIPWL